jgi:hypothetical protein
MDAGDDIDQYKVDPKKRTRTRFLIILSIIVSISIIIGAVALITGGDDDLSGTGNDRLADTDGDSIADDVDRCPNEPGQMDNDGCPLPTNTPPPTQAPQTQAPPTQPPRPTQIPQTQAPRTQVAPTQPPQLTQVPPTQVPPTQPPPTQPPPTQEAIASTDIPSTSTPTNTRVVVAQNVEVEEVTIRNAFGDPIGKAIVKVFAEGAVSYPNSTRVSLELLISSQFVTPTPFGPEITEIPFVTATPGPETPTATPYVPIHEALGVDVYRRMGASLFCPPNSFSGCDNDMDANTAETIGFEDEGQTWTWLLSPNEDVSGFQDLEIRLWRLITIGDGQPEPDAIWNYSFRIDVTSASVEQENTDDSTTETILIIVLAAVVGFAAVVFAYNWYRNRTRRVSIFISYRRQDSQGSAGRIYDHLVKQFGPGAVFHDVDTIEYGEKFDSSIQMAVESVDVLLAVIGTQWISLTDDGGVRRIDNPQDYVRMEIKLALDLEITVIPVLVDGATMPGEDELPDVLQELATRNAIHVRNDSFDDDVKRLIRRLLERNG